MYYGNIFLDLVQENLHSVITKQFITKQFITKQFIKFITKQFINKQLWLLLLRCYKMIKSNILSPDYLSRAATEGLQFYQLLFQLEFFRLNAVLYVLE